MSRYSQTAELLQTGDNDSSLFLYSTKPTLGLGQIEVSTTRDGTSSSPQFPNCPHPHTAASRENLSSCTRHFPGGVDALRSLDDNGDGVLRGEELRGLALWHDGNSNGRSDEGEVRPVTAWGINSLSCTGQPDAAGMAWSPAGVTFDHGEVRPTYDWIAPMRPETK